MSFKPYRCGPHPCPFCGGKATVTKQMFNYNWLFRVKCGGCGATGPGALAKEQALEQWNRRVSE